MAEDAEQRAEQVAAAMWAAARASRGLGMALEDVGPGLARLSMTVRPDMLNGHGNCHGGFIFSLADSAFAFACNARGETTVAQSCTITFLRPAREGDELVATCRELALVGRSGLYDVLVEGPGGSMVAAFRGQSRQVPRP